MGLAASQSRFLLLTARKSDLELQGQTINQQRMMLANIMGSFLNQMSAMDPSNTSQANAIQNQVNALQQRDKILELLLRRVDTQQQAVQTEIQAVQKVIDKNIDMSFKTFA